MTIKEIAEYIDAKIVVGKERENMSLEKAFTSDLMSDVLTVEDSHVLLITGLCNIQTIRTADMADIKFIVIGRNKKLTQDMIDLAEENETVLIACRHSLFSISGILYNKGLKPLY